MGEGLFMPAKKSLAYGAFVLFLSAVFNRILGFVNQVVLVRFIGAEGIGLFNMVFPVYVMGIVIATAGIPVAVAKLVAEECARGNRAGAHKIFRLSLAIILLFSTITTLLVVMGTPFITTKIITNPKAYWAFTAIIPGIFICAVCSAFRGYFQGLSEMTPTALTQVIEQSVRVILGLSVAYYMLPKGIEFAAIGVSVGVVCGELSGLLVMLAIYFFKKPKLTPYIVSRSLRTRNILKNLFSLSVPITISRIISTIIISLDTVLVPLRLEAAGFSLKEATILYGQLSGMALTLLYIPTVITNALSTTLVPAISDAMAQGNLGTVKGRSGEALWVTLIFGLPALVIFFMLPHELTTLLFKYPEAGSALRIVAVGGIFLYIHQITTGILQGLGKPGIVLLNLVLASLVKFSGIYVFTADPKLGINGTALAMCFYFFSAAFLNIRSIAKISGFTLQISKLIFKPSGAILGMALVIFVVRHLLLANSPLLPVTLLSILIGFATYFILLFASGGLTRQDLSRMPYINKFVR